jgi:hypothetical protein
MNGLKIEHPMHFDFLPHPDHPDGLRISLSDDLEALFERFVTSLERPPVNDAATLAALATLAQGQAAILAAIQDSKDTIMADLSSLTAEVARNTTVEASAITLLQGLKTALDAAGTDPVALKALSDQLGTNDTALAAAITADTPVGTGVSTGLSTGISSSLSNGLSTGFSSSLSSGFSTGISSSLSNISSSLSGTSSSLSNTGFGSMSVSPSTLSQAVGAAFTQQLVFSGGTAPYNVGALPQGVFFDTLTLDGDTTTVVGSSTITFTDSSSPARTASLALTVF